MTQDDDTGRPEPDLWATPASLVFSTRCSACLREATITIHVRNFAFNLCDDCWQGLRTILRSMP